MKLTIWHNNVCTTSTKALDYLISEGYDIEIRNYIAQPPTEEELIEVLHKMDKQPEFILRKKDKVFVEKFADANFSLDEWIAAMHLHPSIIERAIVLSDT